MKTKIYLSILAWFMVVASGPARACDSSGSDKSARLEFVSQAGVATLIGFDEFGFPSPSPKKYRHKSITGTMHTGQWSMPDCPDGSDDNISGTVTTITPEASGLTFTWEFSYDPETDEATVLLSKTGGYDPNWYGGQYVWKIEYACTGNISGGLPQIPADPVLVGTIPSAGGTYITLLFNGRHAGNGAAAEFAEVPVVWLAGPAARLKRDEWESDYTYNQDGDITTANENVRFGGRGNFPLTFGGIEQDWDGFLYAPDDVHSYGALVELSQETQTSRTFVGTDECVGTGPYFKVAGTIVEELSDEDTELAALDRAPTTSGTSNTAFRTDRGSEFSFQFSQVHYKATFEQIKCPGDYDVYLHFLVKPHGSDEPGYEKVRIEKRHLMADETLVVEGEITVEALNTDYTLLKAEIRGECAASSAGQMNAKIGSVEINWGLGTTSGGTSAGQLLLKSDIITPEIYTPASLIIAAAYDASVEELRDESGIRQIKAPQTLVDVVALSESSYELRFYSADLVGDQDPETSLYAVNGDPFVTYELKNPDAAEQLYERLYITETQGSEVREYAYTHDVTNTTWSLSRGNGMRHESLVTTSGNGDTTKTSTITGSDGIIVGVTARTYRNYPWGEEMIREVRDPAGAALTTEFVYYDNAGADGDNYGRLKLQTNADGSWSRHTWDAEGRPLTEVRPFLNATSNAAENLCHVVENSYSAMDDLDGDGEPEALTTSVETTLGLETGRSYRIVWSNPVELNDESFKRTSNSRCVTAGAAWDAADNLVTETLSYRTDPFIGRPRRIINPDGTATLTFYELAEDGTLTTTTQSGAANSGLNNIEDGTSRVTVTSAMGETVQESVTDIVSGHLLTSWKATSFDGLGRPTRIDYADGTYTTRTYDCCELASERDRTGLTTSYRYDELGRLFEVARQGITTRSMYDADGRIKRLTRVGVDGSEITIESNVYDLAGRLIERRDALGRLTAYDASYNPSTGETVSTTTNPDLGTVVQVSARDGSMLSVSGSAVAPVNYEYGVEPEGSFTKTILVGPDSATTEWSKNYSDLVGRSYLSILADAATTQSYYNAVGQLERQVDPDGVTTLYAYNSRGEQTVTAIDMNANDAIDYDGIDRIARVTSDVTERGSVVVRRSTTEVWETDESDTPVTAFISEQSVSYMRSWQTVNGLTTATEVTYDGAGGRTVTTTAPDNTQRVEVYVGALLSSTTIQDASAVQLAAATYSYDTHYRLSSVTDARNGATTYTYYDDDLIQSITTPDPDVTQSGTGYDPQTTTYTYDSMGRVSTVTLPDAGKVHTTYYPTGQVKRTWGARTYPVEYTYDPQGRVKTLTTWQDFADDTGQAVTTWNYDAVRGWLNSKHHDDGAGPSYTYQPSGRLATRVWARTPTVTTTYRYNAAGDLDSIDYSDATPDVTIAYDRLGRPLEMTDDSGARALAYLATGQLDTEAYSTGVLDGIVVNRNYDALQRLDGLSVPSIYSVGYSYDDASRLATVTHGQNTATYGYVANSPLIESVAFQQAGSTRLTTTKIYDKLNRLESIASEPSTHAGISAAYTYNSANQRARTLREDAAYWIYDYDDLGQVISGRKLMDDDTPFNGMDYAWTFDDIGNRQTSLVNGQTATYTANLLNQYDERTVPGVVDLLGTALETATVTFAMDDDPPQSATRQGGLFSQQLTVNNTTVAQRREIKITAVQNDAGPEGEDVIAEVSEHAFVAQTPETFVHDADGNLTADARWTYTWDAENRLIAMETAPVAVTAGVHRQKLEFAYDAQSRRYAKKVFSWDGSGWALAKNTFFIYDGWNMIAELDALNSNTVVRTHVWGLDLSGTLQGAGGVGGLLFINTQLQTLDSHAAVYDGNGNVLGLVNMADGTQTASYDYNAFGETVLIEGITAAENPFRFSTKYTDTETRLLYYGYRYYHPDVGRWLSRDPYEEEGGVNLYGFVENSPLEWIDPLGLALYAFDGTNNDGYRDIETNEETNVYVLAKIYKGNAWYIPGVGTNDGLLNLIGSAFGAGGQARESSMLAKAGEFIMNGDTIADIIGFSRGAAQARDFANRLKEKYPCVEIRWIGLFDTVASEGLPNDVNLGYKLGIPEGTGSVLHITAGGERRKKTFALSSIQVAPNVPNPNPNYREVNMLNAVHSDVGGGYGTNRGLANQALQRMWRDGLSNGVPFGPLPVRYTKVAPNGPNDSRWRNDKLIEFLTGRKRVRKVYYHP